MSELPLFPLQTVLLPGGPLALRVFEPRYVDMVARCLRGANRFGVVAIREGAEVGEATPYECGTSAEIVDWSQEPGGLLTIVAHGRDSFRTGALRREPDGLYVAEVAWLPPLEPRPLPRSRAAFATLLERLIEQSPLHRALPAAFDDATWVGARLIELLPLPLSLKQSLLELTDPELRLDRLATVLEARQESP
jgi:Lon protease-like protein